MPETTLHIFLATHGYILDGKPNFSSYFCSELEQFVSALAYFVMSLEFGTVARKEALCLIYLNLNSKMEFLAHKKQRFGFLFRILELTVTKSSVAV